MHQVKHMAIQFPCSFGASVFQTPMQSNNQIQLKKNTCNQYACPQKFNEKEKNKQKVPRHIGHCTSLRTSGNSTKTNLQMKQKY